MSIYDNRVRGGSKLLNGTTSQLVHTGRGDIIGIHVNSSTSGTIKLWDNTSAATTVIVNTWSPNVGWNAIPAPFSTGLYITVGGTIDYTVIYTPDP